LVNLKIMAVGTAVVPCSKVPSVKAMAANAAAAGY
jgi:hypothetical protein